MNHPVYIRPLRLEDALTSYQWRNNSRVWEHTGSKPDKYITPGMETEWLRNVLSRKNEKRFAICLTATDQYIGNVHLANITDDEAEYSGLFIGETEFWGKGLGTTVSTLVVEYAFSELNIKKLTGLIRNDHQASLTMIKKIGFTSEPLPDGWIKVSLSKSAYEKSPQSNT